jgi:membrane-associated protease RseP (regulator of RpoE activity)
MRRTQRGKQIIDKIAQASPKFWKILSTIYVLAAFFLMAYGLYMMIFAAKLIVERTLTVPSLQLVIPLPSAQPVSGPGYLLVPFWFWIVLVPFFMFPHEISHGIIARAHKIRLKSVGALLLAIIPGAFVEPDDRDVNKAKTLTKLRLFSAGSVANIAFVIIFTLIASQVVWPSIVYTGLAIVEVNQTAPAGIAGLKAGMNIESIDGTPVYVDYNDFEISYSLLLLNSQNTTANETKLLATGIAMYKILSKYKAGNAIDVMADGRHYSLTLAQNPNNFTLPYMGVTVKMNEKRPADLEFSTLLPLIWWITTVGYGVAIFNLLPIYPLDGGLIVQAVVEKIFGKNKKSKKIAQAISMFAIGIIIFNFIGPFIIKML